MNSWLASGETHALPPLFITKNKQGQLVIAPMSHEYGSLRWFVTPHNGVGFHPLYGCFQKKGEKNKMDGL